MKNRLKVILIASLSIGWFGCGGASKDAKIVPAGGTLTYNGAPLAGATVSFFPEKGPLAFATTAQDGTFKLSSGALPGCAVGPARVAVRVTAPDAGSKIEAVNMGSAKSPKEMEELSKKMAEMTVEFQKQEKTKSKAGLIPEHYKDADKSKLTYTIDSDPSKNNFKIDLKD